MRKFWIIPNLQKEKTPEVLEKTTAILKEAHQNFEVIDLKSEDHDFKKDDIILFIGGDGTFLRCAHLAYRYDLALCGINTGNLGFLTNAEASEGASWLRSFILNNKTIEECPLLAMEFKGAKIEPIVNDIVLYSLGSYNVFKVYYKDQLIYKTSASGLIVASGIGSTGINLSAYGPVIMKESHNIVLTPICALLGKGYSLVVPLDDDLKIESDTVFKLEIDGQKREDTQNTVTIFSAKKKLKRFV